MSGFKFRQTTGLLILAALLVGCTTKPSAPNYYTLIATPLDAPVVTDISSSIGLWPVELPDLLDRSGIVSYQQQHRVNISSQNIWAGDLAENIARVIGQGLSQQLNLSQFWYYPWESRQSPDYELRIR
ncbi:MAG: ABC-type transport auxiliary lipoprotein family protein, partial [Motiliproteus sp.]